MRLGGVLYSRDWRIMQYRQQVPQSKLLSHHMHTVICSNICNIIYGSVLIQYSMVIEEWFYYFWLWLQLLGCGCVLSATEERLYFKCQQPNKVDSNHFKNLYLQHKCNCKTKCQSWTLSNIITPNLQLAVNILDPNLIIYRMNTTRSLLYISFIQCMGWTM